MALKGRRLEAQVHTREPESLWCKQKDRKEVKTAKCVLGITFLELGWTVDTVSSPPVLPPAILWKGVGRG